MEPSSNQYLDLRCRETPAAMSQASSAAGTLNGLARHADPPEYICAICTETIHPHRQPVLLAGPCETHVFCRECAEELRQKECPVCRKPFEGIMPLSGNRFAWRAYNNARLRCFYECGEAADVADLEGHYRRCNKAKCGACGIVLAPPTTLEDHKGTCPRRLVPCKFVGQGCTDKSLASEELANHEKLCGWRTVKCDLLLCEHECLAKDLKEHEVAAMGDHLKLALEEVKRLRTTVAGSFGVFTVDVGLPRREWTVPVSPSPEGRLQSPLFGCGGATFYVRAALGKAGTESSVGLSLYLRSTDFGHGGVSVRIRSVHAHFSLELLDKNNQPVNKRVEKGTIGIAGSGWHNFCDFDPGMQVIDLGDRSVLRVKVELYVRRTFSDALPTSTISTKWPDSPLED
ncbi:hypothetical protein DFJ74DRAFT_692979 [Hyaloraphidium curvatum]|nr:hypothetical protein DFJ74DRAFT_692979 [Hyaloraphidium curvatum]